MRQAGAYSKLISGGISGKTGPHSLPLARIKKIMKKSSGDKAKMISGEAPIIVSKACELFMEELTNKAWLFAPQGKRTLRKQDVASAVTATDIFDFLVDLVADSATDHEYLASMEI